MSRYNANRREDLRLITGKGKYTSNFNLPGQLYAAFLRSDRAHAQIISIDTAPALALPGVVAAFTGSDAIEAGYTSFPHLMNFKNRNGTSMIKPARPVLAHGRVRHVGEPVVMVVAETAEAAEDALEHVRVEYREIAPAITVDDALAPGAPQIHDNAPGNISFEWDIGDADAVEKAFAQAAHVTRIRVSSQRVNPSPMEPRACLIGYDAATDSYDVYACAQGITFMRWQFAEITNLPDERLRFHMYDVGGSFGQRSGAYPEYAAQMIAARKLRRPIKWVSTRSEGFLSDTHGRAIHMGGEIAIDSQGRFLAARYDLIVELGAFVTTTGSNSHVRNPAIAMTGVYRIPALHGNFRLVFTNTAPVASYRGAGRPDIAYVIERLVDKAADELGMDRAELRRRNFIPPEAFPYKTPTMGLYEKCDFLGCMTKAMSAADWTGFEARREEALRRGKLRGIGMGTVIEGTGLGRFPEDEVAIRFDAHGALTLYTLSLSSGQGHETTFPAIVQDTLGLAPGSVTLRESVQGVDLSGNPSGGSRSLVSVGNASRIAALKLIEHATPLAALELDVEPSQVDYRGGVFRSGNREISLTTLARKLSGPDPHPLNLVAEGVVKSTFPNGCHIAEVEIDPDTGLTDVVSYIAVDDCGNVINHAIVEGQIHGGVMQGAGQVLGEEVVYDRQTGQLLTGSFSDYFLPRAGLIRRFEVIENPLPSTANTLGAKGVGESGCTGSLPTLANAIMGALRPLGVPDLDTPFTPCKVWHALQAVRRR